MATTYFSIKNFGSEDEVHHLVTYINTSTVWHAYVNSDGLIVLTMDSSEVGDFVQFAVTDDNLNWIEYTMQFDV